MRLVGTSIRKRKDVDNSITADVEEMIITLAAKTLVSTDVNNENKHHQHHHHHDNHHAKTMNWNHSDRNTVY